MKFIVDNNLPPSLLSVFRHAGLDAVHSSCAGRLDRASTDAEIAVYADAEGRIVVTKDRLFVVEHFKKRTPGRMLWFSGGNLANKALIALFQAHLSQIIGLLNQHPCVEIDQNGCRVRMSPPD